MLWLVLGLRLGLVSDLMVRFRVSLRIKGKG